jgi:hypothetical protein
VAQTDPAPSAAIASQAFPRTLRIDRPHDDYRLDLQVSNVDLNVDLTADRFQMSQPANSELIRVTSAADSKQPAGDSHLRDTQP